MGQRHQLFVIARIAAKYRCLAALHHQWLYGHTALRRCRDILDIFSNPKNSIALAEELKLAESRDPKFWDMPEDYDSYGGGSDVPFPFIMTCLTIGASFNLEAAYFHGVSEESFYMKFDGGDNNNGITLIDISNLNDIRYCFVDFYGMESERQVQLMSPLSGRRYLEAYYELDKPEYQDLQSCVHDLAPWSLIKTESLEDTWPGEGWEQPDDADLQVDVISKSTASVSVNEAPEPTSLRNRTLDQLADAIVCGESIEPEALAEIEAFTDFWPKTKAKFYEKGASVEFTDQALDLLFKCLRDDTAVDLSPFKLMTSKQMFSLIERLTGGGHNLDGLNLSGTRLSNEELKCLLEKRMNLKGLYLMGHNQGSLEDIAKSKPEYDVFQHELLKRPLVEYKTSITSTTSLPMLDFEQRQHPVTHLAWIGLGVNFLKNENSDSYQADGHLKYDKMMIEKKRLHRGLGGMYGALLRCRKYPITDIPLPMTRLTTGLRTFLQWLPNSSAPHNHSDVSKVAAISFALGATNYDNVATGVGPLSNELYLNNGNHDISMQKLRPGQWAIMVLHPLFDDFTTRDGEPYHLESVLKVMNDVGKGVNFDPAAVYYAFITPKPDDGGYEVADAPQFLERVGTVEAKQLASWWTNQHNENARFARFYDKPDIQEIAKSIYPSEEEPVGGGAS